MKTKANSYERSVVEAQVRLHERKGKPTRAVCPDFTTICYAGGPCPTCSGKGWITV